MSKSIISLVLSNATVSKVDRECARTGKSRSQLIDDLLARHYGIDLPSIRFSEIVGMLNERMAMLHTVSVLQDVADNAVEFRTALTYRYQPKILFQIQFSMSEQWLTATLRISTRTTSAALLSLLKDFFMRLDNMEVLKMHVARREGMAKSPLPEALPVESWDRVKPMPSDLGRAPVTAFDGTRFIRQYRFNALETTSEEVADLLLNTCKWVNRSLNLYFGREEGGPGFEPSLEKLYFELLKTNR
jgi:hypothetical protein